MPRDYGHIPMTIRSQAVTLQSQPVSTEKILTCFIGIMSEDAGFDDEHWANNRDRVKSLLKVPDECVVEVPITPNPNDSSVVDHAKLGTQMSGVMEKLNSLPKPASGCFGLRVVRLGIRNSMALYQAIESLVEAWELPPDDKCVQFVALGDTSDRDWLHFTRWLCLSGSVKKVQYFQTMDYNNYGFIDQRQHFVREANSARGNDNPGLSLLNLLAQNMGSRGPAGGDDSGDSD